MIQYNRQNKLFTAKVTPVETLSRLVPDLDGMLSPRF